MGDHVGHVAVPVVAYGGIDRDRAVGDAPAEAVVVEAGQVQDRAAAAQDEDRIVCRPGTLDAVEGVHDGLRRGRALHRRLEQVCPEREAVFVAVQVAREVAVAGGVARRDDGQRIRQRRRDELLLLVQESFGFEFRYGPALLELLLAERELRVEVIHSEGEAVELAVGHLDPDEHRHPRLEGRTGGGHEVLVEGVVFGSPDDGFRPGYHAIWAVLAQVHVAVSVGLEADGRDLRPHPDLLREQVLQTQFQTVLQGVEIDVLHFHEK